jgi:hypothetical protein
MSERETAAREFAEAMGWTWTHPSGIPDVGYSWFTINEVGDQIGFPLANRPLHEHLEFVGRVAEAVFPSEDIVFRCGWVHGVLENCIEDARWKYDPPHAALLAGTAALRERAK